MIIYTSNKKEFMNHVENDSIACVIDKYFRDKIGKSNYREFKSWDNSMQYMYKVLNTDLISDYCGVAIEYRIPSSSKRIDFIISGISSDKSEHVVIIELKQWERLEYVEGKDALVRTYINKHNIETVHPSYQAWTYASLIEDFNEAVQEGKILIHPCAYLHNYINLGDEDPIINENYNEYLVKAPVYRKGDAIKLREFICEFIQEGDNGECIAEIENGKITPSKSLQDSLELMLDGNEEFKMIDEQKVVFENIMKIIKKSIWGNEKSICIVKGGPGTGKSVLAINMLVKLINNKFLAYYVTKNLAPREVYEKKLKNKYSNKYIKNLFKGSGSFIGIDSNEIDVIIADEAHRLMAKSGIFKNLGENQIKEIIKASKVSIFFIDENQKVTIDDIGSIAEIKKYAKRHEAKITELQLSSQFRCSGSDSYLNWIDESLEINNNCNFDCFELDYDVRILDSPNEIFKLIKDKNKKNNKSRMLAGYCWEWESKKNFEVFDIILDDFQMKWNLNSSKTWAIDENSINEIGCVHTAQGLEFDYVGVIIGEDLRFENGKIVTDFTKRAKTDKSLKGIKKMYKENPNKALEISDMIIKNTYKTLMTRGMKGCYIYCVDKNLSTYLDKRLKKMKEIVGNKDIIIPVNV